jgi:hypothetical protein
MLYPPETIAAKFYGAKFAPDSDAAEFSRIAQEEMCSRRRHSGPVRGNHKRVVTKNIAREMLSKADAASTGADGPPTRFIVRFVGPVDKPERDKPDSSPLPC